MTMPQCKTRPLQWSASWTILTVLFNYTSANRTSVETLYKGLLSNYNPYIRPNDDQDQQTTVRATLHLIAINDVDELSGTMSTVVYVDVTWKDPRMMWDKAYYNNVWQILVPQNLVWKPDLVVTNPVKKVRKIGFDDIMIRYNDNGVALWYTGDYLETSCDIDVTHFPFDRQVCTIVMIPWNYRHRELQLFIVENNIKLDNFTENGEWILYDTAAERVGDGPFEYIYFKLYLERRSSFFIINLFIPVVLLVFLNCMVFLLSADSGERIGYAITCLLAITVYLTLVSDTIPKSSKPISVLTFVLMVLLILSTLICFLTIIGLRFHFRSERKPLPKWLCKLSRILRCKKIRKQFGRIFKSDCRQRRIRSAENQHRSPEPESHPGVSQQTEFSKPIVSIVGSSDGKDASIYRQSFHLGESSEVIYEDCDELPEYDLETWKTFAKLFDKYCFILCVSAVIIIGALYFMISSGRLSV